MALIARVGAALALADGEVRAVLTDALAALVEDHGIIAAHARRKVIDRERKRTHSTDSKESTEASSAESTENTECAETLPPQVSPSFPTPHITPSSPPLPLLHLPEEEIRLRERAPAAWPAIERFLATRDPAPRIAWVGRFHAALDRPPHLTDAELADAVGDMLGKPETEWNPPRFRSFVNRVRRDVLREADRDAAAIVTTVARGMRGMAADPADAAWNRVMAMVPAWHRKEVTAEVFAALPWPIRQGLSAVGSFASIVATPQDKLVWKQKEFSKAYHLAATPRAASPDLAPR